MKRTRERGSQESLLEIIYVSGVRKMCTYAGLHLLRSSQSKTRGRLEIILQAARRLINTELIQMLELSDTKF